MTPAWAKLGTSITPYTRVRPDGDDGEQRSEEHAVDEDLTHGVDAVRSERWRRGRRVDGVDDGAVLHVEDHRAGDRLLRRGTTIVISDSASGRRGR